ncbi:MAG: DUF3325 domain-containing protein [Pseudomonadota bacterium]
MGPFLTFGLLLIAYALSTLGCALLAFSQTRHWRAIVEDRKATAPHAVKAGWALIFLALVPCVVRDGGSFAALLWPLVFAASAMSVAMLLTYKPSWLRSLAFLIAPKSRNHQ